ncbi:MAG TPA: DUF72 domain-containing protein [Gemmatimonadaceae bacterium]|nr:DUF72 domain-containing protein [Gemmatimonadaceae bacterium]
MTRASEGTVRIGISGWDYPGWRGAFYPPELPRRAWLRYACRTFDSIELNGTFYSLKSPDAFVRWRDESPEGFVYAVKGSRFITHNLKLRHARTALANFFASGVLALGARTGPFLWQLPATYRFDHDRLAEFLDLLPRDSADAERLARLHDDRLPHGALLESPEPVSYRHALEPRHPSYFGDEAMWLLRDRRCALVVADTAGRFPTTAELTADFVYVRLHGSRALYASRYDDAELDAWAERIAWWACDAPHMRHDVYAYFDNDAHAHAPHDARRLAERVRAVTPLVRGGGS